MTEKKVTKKVSSTKTKKDTKTSKLAIKEKEPKAISKKAIVTKTSKSKTIGSIPTKVQQKLFDKVVNNNNFVRKRLINQLISNHMTRILDINENKLFVVIDNEYFLYNETTKVVREFGSLFDTKNPPKIEHSKDIPWNEV